MWAAYGMIVVANVGLLVLLAAMITATQHHLAGAADLAALSGAARLQHGGDACASAAEIAKRNGVKMTRCVVDGQDVEVTVTEIMTLPLDIDGTMTQRARAGP